MKPSLSVVLAVVVSLMAVLVGCGSGNMEDHCVDGTCAMESVEQTALCYWCANPPPGCGEEPPPTPTTMRFALGLWNGAAESRACTLSYSYRAVSGSTVSGALASGEVLPARYWRGGLLDAWTGSTVTMTATCQHPDYPSNSIRATRTLTTLPMDRERTCRAIYSEAPTPTLSIPCWEGHTAGQSPGIEFVTVVVNNSASATTVNLGYVPAADGGGMTGPELALLSGLSLGPSLQTRTGIFAPIGGVVTVHFSATTNGIVSELSTDVLLDDPSMVPTFTVNPNGTVFMKKSGF